MIKGRSLRRDLLELTAHIAITRNDLNSVGNTDVFEYCEIGNNKLVSRLQTTKNNKKKQTNLGYFGHSNQIRSSPTFASEHDTDES